MIELIQITNDPAIARRCDAIAGTRLFVDLERHGKAQRQVGRGSFISTHALDDVGRVRAALNVAQLMVRVNPLHDQTAEEVEAALAQGAQRLMLPMFRAAAEVRQFLALVAGRVPVSLLLETREALANLQDWIATPGIDEVFVGLNDLHLSLGLRFMFEPLALGMVEDVAQAAHANGLRFGFGGIARMDEGLLPGRDVLAEHLRLGSGAVILSRTFHRHDAPQSRFEEEVQALRMQEQALGRRTAAQVQTDAQRIRATIAGIASAMAKAA
jgi:hypothetical protein